MPRRTRTPRPVKSFSAHYLGVYRAAADPTRESPVEIPCESKREAQALRAKLNELRSALKHENHPLYEVAVRCTNYLRGDSASGWKIVCAKADFFHEERIRAAGIEPFRAAHDLKGTTGGPTQ